MNSFVVMAVTISIGIAVGTAADYWMINVYIKYALMALAITLSLRVLGEKKGKVKRS
ncbi:hypothetical protein LZ838_01205 [Pseudomonas sp. AA27]|uniref:hypothetical protein n=1 Tax=Pseudomonas sp. AA27 TaxID=2908652 RepID=UPI001F231FE8|nr:hypothetical protein [Pseudomonas sp. AA27]MCF1485972.1 hypothetical protein [Pseudomonas sp. AA27]